MVKIEIEKQDEKTYVSVKGEASVVDLAHMLAYAVQAIVKSDSNIKTGGFLYYLVDKLYEMECCDEQ